MLQSKVDRLRSGMDDCHLSEMYNFNIAGEGGGFRTGVGQSPKGVRSPKCASPNTEFERLGDWVADRIRTAPQSSGVGLKGCGLSPILCAARNLASDRIRSGAKGSGVSPEIFQVGCGIFLDCVRKGFRTRPEIILIPKGLQTQSESCRTQSGIFPHSLRHMRGAVRNLPDASQNIPDSA